MNLTATKPVAETLFFNHSFEKASKEMRPNFTTDGKLKDCKFTVVEVRRLDETIGMLTLLSKFDVGFAGNALKNLRKLRDQIDEKNTLSMVGADGAVRASLFEPGSQPKGDPEETASEETINESGTEPESQVSSIDNAVADAVSYTHLTLPTKRIV